MNKKIIAAAIAAGLYAPIAVDAAPTVYGRAQVEISSFSYNDYTGVGDFSGDKDNRSVVDNGMGRVGVKGAHDLGGGLSGLYKFEFKADTADGTPSDGPALTARKTYVGLKGGFGTVTVGRDSSPYKDTNMDSHNATTLEARSWKSQSHGAFGHSSFVSQMVKWSNQFGDVKVSALYGLYSDEDDANNPGEEGGYSVAADYTSGPLRVVAALSNETTDATGDDDTSRTKLAAQFKTGPWKFTGQYETVEGLGGASGDEGEVDFMYVAGEFTMGKNSLMARLGQRDYGDGDEADADHMTVALTHRFNKQTRAWVGYSTFAVDDDEAVLDYVANTLGADDLNGMGGLRDEDILSVGMRVDF